MPGRGEVVRIESDWWNKILLRNPLSPKTFRKGGGEQLRRGFVQPGNANNPLLRYGLDTFLDFVRPIQRTLSTQENPECMARNLVPRNQQLQPCP